MVCHVMWYSGGGTALEQRGLEEEEDEEELSEMQAV